jgi:tRNA nucleotidyltransferase (CCA-adding enzyme)
MNFLRAVSKEDGKTVIDIEKQYKNKNQVLMDINSAKLQSPVILVDPTYKQRNVLAALSEQTFRKLQEKAKKFLKNPSVKAFEPQKLDIEKIKKMANRKKYEFVIIESKTGKQKGDIAGSKLLKFYNHLKDEAKKYFEIKSSDFEYDEQYKKGKTARFFFVAKKKKEVLIKGPSLSQKEHSRRFKAKNKSTFIKRGRFYSKHKVNFTLKKFINEWKKKNKRQMGEMGISELSVKN